MTGAQAAQVGLGLAAALAAFAITSSRGRRARRDDGPDGDPRRAAVVDAAMGQVGQSDPTDYWAATLPGVDPATVRAEWCGAFALWALKRAGLATDIDWELGKGFCFRLPTTDDPQPGDVAYFDEKQHHAIVARVEGSEVVTVDGNQPDVRVRRRLKSAAAAYFSIVPLLDSPVPSDEGRVLA